MQPILPGYHGGYSTPCPYYPGIMVGIHLPPYMPSIHPWVYPILTSVHAGSVVSVGGVGRAVTEPWALLPD